MLNIQPLRIARQERHLVSILTQLSQRFQAAVVGCIASLGVVLLLASCSKVSSDSSLEKSHLKKISIDLRSNKDFDLDALNQEVPSWFSSQANQSAVFQESLPYLADNSASANWKDIESVEDALLVHSLAAAKRGDEPSARASLALCVSISLQFLDIPTQNELVDTDKRPLSKHTITTTTVILSRFGLASIKHYLEDYPLNAKSWSWYRPAYDKVSTAHSSTSTLTKRLLVSVSSSSTNSSTWDLLLQDTRRQMVSEYKKLQLAVDIQSTQTVNK